MKTKIYLFSLPFLLFVNINFVYAQQVKKTKKAIQRPFRYKNPVEKMDISPSSEEPSGKTWIVFSDRENNKTYTGCDDGSSVKETLAFLDEFYIAEEKEVIVRGKKEQWVKLMKDKEHGVLINQIFSDNAKNYGWIKKDHLLLWSSCLVTNIISNINRKAMLLNSPDVLKGKETEHKKVFFYKDPDLNFKTNTHRNLYEIFFVYKLTGKSALIGKKGFYSETEEQAKETILGWVSKDRLSFWNHRVAIEPNHTPDAVAERKQKGIKAQIVNSIPDAVNLKKGGKSVKAIWNKDSEEKRNIGKWIRFPVLECDECQGQEVIRVGTMGEISTKMGEKWIKGKLSPESSATIQSKVNEIRRKRRNINVVFVIDGTSSMQRAFPSVRKGLCNSIKQLENEYKNNPNTLRFGVVVYRDCLEKDRVKELKPITTDTASIINFLKKIEAKDSLDKDAPEAVYYGLKHAFRSIGMKKDQTNIIILVGDAGNHHRNDKSQVDKKTIINYFVDYGCHLIAIQMRRPKSSSSKTYEEFAPQLCDIIIEANKIKYEKIKEKFGNDYKKEVPKQKYNTDSYFFQLSAPILYENIVRPKKGNQFLAKTLQEEIKESILAINEINNKLLNYVSEVFEAGNDIGNIDKTENISKEEEKKKSKEDEENPQKNKYNEIVDNYEGMILDLLCDVDSIPIDQIKLALKENFQFYYIGHTPTKIDGLEYPLFEYVLFMNRTGLAKMLIDFEKIFKAISADDERLAMRNAWIGLLKKHIGDKNINPENLSVEEAGKKVFGLPGTSEFIKNVKIKDITDPAKFLNPEFQKYKNDIRMKYIYLEKVLNTDNYFWSFYSNDERYYWILQDYLP